MAAGDFARRRSFVRARRCLHVVRLWLSSPKLNWMPASSARAQAITPSSTIFCDGMRTTTAAVADVLDDASNVTRFGTDLSRPMTIQPVRAPLLAHPDIGIAQPSDQFGHFPL
jgi:hypothetical protein